MAVEINAAFFMWMGTKHCLAKNISLILGLGPKTGPKDKSIKKPDKSSFQMVLVKQFSDCDSIFEQQKVEFFAATKCFIESRKWNKKT